MYNKSEIKSENSRRNKLCIREEYKSCNPERVATQLNIQTLSKFQLALSQRPYQSCFTKSHKTTNSTKYIERSNNTRTDLCQIRGSNNQLN